MRRRASWIGAAVVAGALLGGCSELGAPRGEPPRATPESGTPAPSPPQPQSEVALDETPSIGPGLTPGVYDLHEAKLPSPWVRTVAGYLPPMKAGQWGGTLWRLGRDVRAQVEVTGRGEAASGKLIVDTNGDLKLDEPPVESLSAKPGPDVGGTPATVLTFPPVTVQGRQVALVAEVAHTPQAGARVFIAQDTCRQATVKAGQDEHLLRFVEGPGAQQPGGAILWIDADGDSEAAEWEVAPVAMPVGFAGRLRTFHLDRPAPGKLTVEAHEASIGVVKFDATDGHGKPAGVCNPGFTTPTGAIQYLGVVTAAEVPAGSARFVYGLPVGPTSMAVAASERPLNIPAGGAVEVKAGGPVQIAVNASAGRGGEINADVKVATATAHGIGGFSGPQEGSGTVEVVAPDGKVLAVGKAEFG